MHFYPYGILVSSAVVLGMILFAVNARKSGIRKETVSWLACLALPSGFLLSRLLYCLCRLTWFEEQGFAWFFHFQDGGYMMYGACFGVLLALWLTSKITGENMGAISDALAAPAMLTYAIGRAGDLLAGQGYGWPIEDWFSVDAFDPEEYTGMSVFHLEDASFFERLPFAVEDAYYGNYRWAVSLFIGVIALAIFVFILCLKVKRTGSKAILMLAWLAGVTVLMESMRQDDLMRWGVVRVSQILSAVLLAILLVVCQVRAKPVTDKKPLILEWIALLASMGLVMIAEFMLEKKIVFLDFVPMDGCYVLMILACLALVMSVRMAWKRQERQ